MAPVDDREGWRRLVASLAEWTRGLDGASQGARVIERDGVVASVIPAASERSVVNSVVYEHAAGLARAYDELEAAYEEAWTVWVPDADPEAMVLDLDEIERPPTLARPSGELIALSATNPPFGVPPEREAPLPAAGSEPAEGSTWSWPRQASNRSAAADPDETMEPTI